MKMKTAALIFLSFLFPILVFAQENQLKPNLSSGSQFGSINLNQYRVTNYKHSALVTDFQLGGYNSFFSNTAMNLFNYSSNGALSYSNTKLNRNYQGLQRFKVDYGINNTKTSADFGKSKTNNFGLSLNFLSNNRNYIKKNIFYGINLLSTNRIFYKKITENIDPDAVETITNEFESETSGSIQFGKGRIENVTDARMAIYILDDLTNYGRLSRTPTQEEVFEFADLITVTLNKRLADNRIKKIMGYMAVDSFLVSKGLVEKSDGLYFGLINDNWNYARLNEWETGKEWFIDISPSFAYSNSLSKTIENSFTINDLSDNIYNYRINLNVGYRSTWISGLKWQQGFFVQGNMSVNWLSDNSNYKYLHANSGYYRKYIPNTRTLIVWQSYLTVGKYFYYNTPAIIYPTISMGGKYYFSEKLSLYVYSYMNYKTNHKFDTHDFGFYINSSLQYVIF